MVFLCALLGTRVLLSNRRVRHVHAFVTVSQSSQFDRSMASLVYPWLSDHTDVSPSLTQKDPRLPYSPSNSTLVSPPGASTGSLPGLPYSRAPPTLSPHLRDLLLILLRFLLCAPSSSHHSFVCGRCEG
ncbi:hypothetical protein BDR03DRAFT_946135 [Suillus americanus]|nr:hypothetical protein BDR03DRAFT_946135 [Suillus americanus]